MGDMIAIHVGVWDSFCLQPLLAREIEAAERRLRALRQQISAAEAGSIEACLGQLRACRDALATARAGARDG